MIAGLGVDVCEIARMRRALEARTGARFRARVFTEREQAYCDARRRGRFESYAARFAAKEAAMKALGTGWADGVGWRDVEVVRASDEGPGLVLHGRAAAIARRRHLGRWFVALSHTVDAAIACVVVEKGSVRTAGRGAGARRPASAGRSGRPRPTGRP